MRKTFCSLILILLAGTAVTGSAATGEFVFVITAGNAMPLGHIEGTELTGGILKDLGEAIAQKLERKPVFLILPRKRMLEALVNGEADARCYARPQWDDSDVLWSKPLIPSGDVVATRVGAKVPDGPRALSGVRVGTVTGYRYPSLEDALGAKFVRDDAPTEESNVAKLVAGRFDHAVVNKLFYHYFRKTSGSQTVSAKYLTLAEFDAQCAVSRKSSVPLAQFNQAIDAIVTSGSFAKIMAKYR